MESDIPREDPVPLSCKGLIPLTHSAGSATYPAGAYPVMSVLNLTMPKGKEAPGLHVPCKELVKYIQHETYQTLPQLAVRDV